MNSPDSVCTPLSDVVFFSCFFSNDMHREVLWRRARGSCWKIDWGTRPHFCRVASVWPLISCVVYVKKLHSLNSLVIQHYSSLGHNSWCKSSAYRQVYSQLMLDRTRRCSHNFCSPTRCFLDYLRCVEIGRNPCHPSDKECLSPIRYTSGYRWRWRKCSTLDDRYLPRQQQSLSGRFSASFRLFRFHFRRRRFCRTLFPQLGAARP